jgi:hypothetical protein
MKSMMMKLMMMKSMMIKLNITFNMIFIIIAKYV